MTNLISVVFKYEDTSGSLEGWIFQFITIEGEFCNFIGTTVLFLNYKNTKFTFKDIKNLVIAGFSCFYFSI